MTSEYYIQAKTELSKNKKGLNKAAAKTLNQRNPKRQKETQKKPKIKPTYTR